MADADQKTPKHETVMDVTQEQVARVYAQAFLGVVSQAANAGDLVNELVSVVDDVLDRFPKLDQTLQSSLVAQEQKEQLLDRIFARSASREILYFLKVVSRHERLGLVRQVARLVKKMHATSRGMTDVEVRLASPLNDKLRDEIRNHLRKALGTEPVLNVKIDPSLIAGIVVRVGDRVYDGSLHTQFERARTAMIDLATEQIERQPERFAVG